MRRLRVQLRLLGRGRRRAARRLGAAAHRLRDGAARMRARGSRAVRAAVVLGLISAVSLAAGVLGATFYGQFGYHPGRDAEAWASRAPQFVGTTSCAGCHADQAGRWAGADHARVSCESCHGPLAGHPAATAEPVQGLAIPGGGSATLCLTCHGAATARPAGFPVIEPSAHNPGPDCVACHDPHAAAAPQVPRVLHPMAGLPECTLCHSPAGMRPLPTGHPTWPGSCLTCHKTGEP